MKNCQKIMAQWLKEHGYDGLYSAEHKCGCLIENLMPCNTANSSCYAAYCHKRTDGSGYEWAVGPEKAELALSLDKMAVQRYQSGLVEKLGRIKEGK